MNPDDLSRVSGTIAHEITHALGFSSSKFEYFLQPGTTNFYPNFGFGSVYSNSFDATLGRYVSKITTPKVVDFVKSFFNCQSWPGAGAELENQGGSGTVNSHWEKRLFPYEYMNPISESTMIRSALTLAYFEDSGWYQVDYTHAQTLIWGAGEGCDFARRKCSEGWSNFYFCRTPYGTGCTVDMKHQAQCNLVPSHGSSIESPYQYFPGEPGKAGSVSYADYCPYYLPVTALDCTNPATSGHTFYGEKTGSGSRCFMGTYLLNSIAVPLKHHSGCLETTCNSGLITVTLKATPTDTVVVCPLNGGEIDLTTVPGSHFKGTLQCPPAKVLCSGNPCDMIDCNNRGICAPITGECSCDEPYENNTLYDCALTKCPTAVPGEDCSGNGTCNRNTGKCHPDDDPVNPGCNEGFSGPDCSNETCPMDYSSTCPIPGEPCECSGKGTCVLGVCQCASPAFGPACAVTECPNNCTDPANGFCDPDTGFCACSRGVNGPDDAFHHTGAACETHHATEQEPLTIHFFGDTSPDNPSETIDATPVVLAAKETKYYTFFLPSMLYSVQFVFDYSGSSPLPDVPPSIVGSFATSPWPTAMKGTYQSEAFESEGKVVLELSPAKGRRLSTTSKNEFYTTGYIRVAVSSHSAISGNLRLERDDCATLNCVHGECLNGQCICDRKFETGSSGPTYGWSGELCDEPDCPGNPSCNGQRGRCVVPDDPPDEADDDVLEPTKIYPSCECEQYFTGISCSQYDVPSLVLGSIPSMTPTGGGRRQSQDGYLVYDPLGSNGLPTLRHVLHSNGTGWSNFANPVGPIGIGEASMIMVIDMKTLTGASYFSGSVGLHVRLDALASPKADPFLIGQLDSAPTLKDYRDFDAGAWRARSAVHEISTTLSSGSLYFITIANGKYATESMKWSLTVEIASSCPTGLNNCSGNGVCSHTCQCNSNFEGIMCDVPINLIAEDTWTPVSNMSPGEWKYFLYKPSDTTGTITHVRVTLDGSQSPGAAPLLTAAWQLNRNGQSIGSLRGERTMYDYDGIASPNQPLQGLTLHRNSPSQQVWLYIGVTNLPSSKKVYSGELKLEVFTSYDHELLCYDYSLTTQAPPPDPLPSMCYPLCRDRGSISTSATGQCLCDSGWNSGNGCASPAFPSFHKLAIAAQKIDFLCSVCTATVPLTMNSMHIWKVPQPLQVNTTLVLSAKSPGGPLTHPPELYGSGRRLQSSPVHDFPIGEEDDMSFIDANGIGAATLLLSSVLPRSPLDFLNVARNEAVNGTFHSSLSISNPSESGSYWVLMLAHSPGHFSIAVNREDVSIPLNPTPSSAYLIVQWMQGTENGKYAVLGGAILIILSLLVCLCACFIGGRARGKEKRKLWRSGKAKMDKVNINALPETPTQTIVNPITGGHASPAEARNILAKPLETRQQDMSAIMKNLGQLAYKVGDGGVIGGSKSKPLSTRFGPSEVQEIEMVGRQNPLNLSQQSDRATLLGSNNLPGQV